MPFSADELLAALPRLRRYARFLTDDADRADDLVEKTLARARQVRDERPLGAAAPVELIALLRSVYADEFARATGQSPGADAHPNGHLPPPRADHREGLLAQLIALPLEQREVVVLVAVERLSYAEIATVLHVPVATVIARLLQAREVLRSGGVVPLTEPKSAH